MDAKTLTRLGHPPIKLGILGSIGLNSNKYSQDLILSLAYMKKLPSFPFENVGTQFSQLEFPL